MLTRFSLRMYGGWTTANAFNLALQKASQLEDKSWSISQQDQGLFWSLHTSTASSLLSAALHAVTFTSSIVTSRSDFLRFCVWALIWRQETDGVLNSLQKEKWINISGLLLFHSWPQLMSPSLSHPLFLLILCHWFCSTWALRISQKSLGLKKNQWFELSYDTN